MSTLTFFGRVLPEIFAISVPNVPPVKWALQSDPSFRATLRTTIENSAVTVACDMQADPGDISSLYVHAIDLARAVVNMIAFSKGWPLVIIFDDFERDGVRSKLIPENPALDGLCTAFTLEHDFESVRNIVLEDPILALTLDDLVRTISVPHYSPIGCARVLDGLKNLIAAGMSDKDAWAKLRGTLNIDENYLKFVTNASKDHRHGKRTRIEGDVTRELSIRTWTVMNRYLEHRKRGNVELPLDEFPQLADA